MTPELIVDARNAVGESPVWSAAEQALYWVDIPSGGLHRWHLPSGQQQRWQAPQMLACIAQSGQGHWIAGLESGLFELRIDGEQLHAKALAGVEHAQPAMRFNDGRCDRQGRFWAGTMLLDMAVGAAVGALYRYEQGQRRPLDPAISPLIVPNGLAFSPDGRTLYLSDSHPKSQQIWAYDYDLDSGTPGQRRLFVDMNQHPGRPDGAAVDVDGCYWTCANDAGLIHRFTPQGKLDRSLQVPVLKPTMCAFGGPRLDTLFITSIRPGGDLSEQPLAGGVFALNPGVCGLEETPFGTRT